MNNRPCLLWPGRDPGIPLALSTPMPPVNKEISAPGQIVTFRIDQPFDAAIRALRRTLTSEGLRVPCELDTSARLQKELGIGLRQNVVLYVDDPVRLLEATVMNPAGALFIPEPVAVSGDAKRTTVSLRSLQQAVKCELPASVRAAVLSLHEKLLTAIGRLGRKQLPIEPEPERRYVPV